MLGQELNSELLGNFSIALCGSRSVGVAVSDTWTVAPYKKKLNKTVAENSKSTQVGYLYTYRLRSTGALALRQIGARNLLPNSLAPWQRTSLVKRGLGGRVVALGFHPDNVHDAGRRHAPEYLRTTPSMRNGRMSLNPG